MSDPATQNLASRRLPDRRRTQPILFPYPLTELGTDTLNPREQHWRSEVARLLRQRGRSIVRSSGVSAWTKGPIHYPMS